MALMAQWISSVCKAGHQASSRSLGILYLWWCLRRLQGWSSWCVTGARLSPFDSGSFKCFKASEPQLLKVAERSSIKTNSRFKTLSYTLCMAVLLLVGFYKVIKQGVLLIQDFPSTVVLYFGQYLQGYLSKFTAGSRSSLHGCAWLCLVALGRAWSCLVMLGCAWLCLVMLGCAWLWLASSTITSPYLQGLLYKYHWTFKTGFPSSGPLWPSKVFVQGFNRSSWWSDQLLLKQEEDLVRFDHPD
ncbi:uncharacterized protein B0P05DRAFT_576382 [Gilbertella persicaria]|uniref:uncharacterized protein n=1 Tax=Gilbertella persicaria TaxID=101096 RepID=UPI0022205753|nr:uncharacterized protein B0P05DRAFT_576382 [Gilbertella persicaria]KAI8047302.1 hypothetical protein B0P05DRAFT_576382 [Gilbertella persicaria]